MKNKPFLIASIVFGGAGLLLILISAAIFLTKDISFCDNLGKLLGIKAGTLNNSTLAELASIFCIPAFIFAYKALQDEAFEDDDFENDNRITEISENTLQ